MALVIADRVRQTTTTTGTGTITLTGTVTGYQTFAVIGNANTVYYTISDPATGAWEVGIGTYTATGTTLSRSVLASSNAGALVSFAAGTKDVWGDYPAGKAVTTDTLATPPAIGSTTANTGAFTTLSASSTLTATSTLTLSGSTTGVNSFGTNQTTAATSMCTSQTTGTFTLGGTATTGTMTLGRSTGTQTTNIQAGATTTGLTKTINLGTGGGTGSITAINIGAASSTATSRTTLNGWTIYSTSAAITATGTTQTAAAPLYTTINNVTVVTSTANGVLLPTAIVGMRILVRNSDSADALKIYPAVGASINALALNTAYSLAAGATIEFIATTTIKWYTF